MLRTLRLQRPPPAVGVDAWTSRSAWTTTNPIICAGMKTGLIVTCRITHNCGLEVNIVLQGIGHAYPLRRIVDVMLGGGGHCFFTPNTTAASCRDDDDIDVLARGFGNTVFLDRKTFDKKSKLPYLGLFASTHLSYEIDGGPG
ncbi:hypothetical protein FN846DRAFT_909778 [Sphaerosporella brunnea]|uniref:Uncharacterized protein n=1 Tax=Sphaerosporella brunnea TaxID=1250544 RepID=A0A5J5EQ27_9PEZI|nr:hypothetical protein FN846DRAFT_909778 [Sphaerosporella brunnea]